MMSNRSLSRTWALVATGLVSAGLALSITGCGGDGPPRDGWTPGGSLLVQLEVIPGHRTGRYGVEVDQVGRCTAVNEQSFLGHPVGYFGLALGHAQLGRLRAAVEEADASLPDPFVPYPGPPDSTTCRLTLRAGDRLRTVEFNQLPTYVPRAVRPLYHVDEATFREEGLLGDILRKAWQHPTEAIALYTHTPKTEYRLDEPMRIHLVVRSVGAHAVAVPTLECREIVSGHVWVSDRECADEWTVTFGGEGDQPVLDRLTPRARRDLANVAKLSPAAGYEFVFPQAVRMRRRGQRRISVGLITVPRYTREVLERRIGVRLATGSLVAAPLTVNLGN